MEGKERRRGVVGVWSRVRSSGSRFCSTIVTTRTMLPPLLHRTRGPQRRVESLSRASLSFSSLSSSLSLSTYPSVYIYSYPLLLRGCSFIPRHATFVSLARFLLHFSTFLFFIIIFFFFFGKSKGLVFSNSAYFFPSPLRACVANDSANSGGYFIFFLFSRI